MANSGVGQAVNQAWTGFRDEKLLAVGTLNKIGKAQADHIRLQNLSQMAANKNRNNASLGRYSPATKYRRGKVDLNRTGSFWKAITGKVTGAKVTKQGVAQIDFEISVPKKFAGRVEGFRTGKYGKVGRAIKRPVLGMADRGTGLRTQQEKQLRKIAMKEYAKELRGADIKFTSRDF